MKTLMLLLVIILLMSCESNSKRHAETVKRAASIIEATQKIIILDETITKEGVVITLFKCNNVYFINTSTGGIIEVNIQSLY